MSPSAAAKTNVIDFIQPDKAKDVGSELEVSTKALVQRFGTIAVIDRASCQQAVLDRQAIGATLKNIETFFQPFTSMADKLHKALTGRRSDIQAPLLVLDARLRSAIGTYTAEQDRLKRIEEQRLADERRREDEARAASEAAQLESAGEHAMAAAVMEEAIAAPVPVVVLPSSTTQIDGLKTVKYYKWRYVNNDPVRAAQLIPREFMAIDEKKLTAFAKGMKMTGKVPGIEFYTEELPVR